jgi:lysozyme
MTLHPRLTPATVALVKRFETLQSVAEPTPSGGWSIGYGHTASAREGARVSPADAEALLTYDLDRSARAVERALFAPVTQAQFEALTALCFNLGEPAFLRSTALARVNAGAELDAADEIERWRQAELGAGTQVVDALVRRRAAEKAHFLGLPEGVATWPSAQRRPLPAPGGEAAEPTAAVQCPPSAALTAADGVQARLRRLIPDDETEAEPPPPDPGPPSLEMSPKPEVSAAEEALIAPPAPVATIIAGPDADGAAEVGWEPTPPPFDPPHPPIAPTAAADPVREAVSPLERPAPRAPAHIQEAPATVAPIRRRALRAPYAATGLLGVVLFFAGAAMILGGRPGLLNLALGVLGVLLAVTGLYGLLGVSRTPDALPTPDEGPSAKAQPFNPAAADTK